MNRRLLALAVSLITASACAAQAPPNIVLIISDDQGWPDYSFMGHQHIQTPNLDRLAKDSLVFRRGYVPSSLCSPSLTSIITGKYPHQHGITGNDPQLAAGVNRQKNPDFRAGRARMQALLESSATLPGVLAKKGYRSLQTGKWWQGSYRTGGFTHGMTQDNPARGGRHGDAGLDIGRKGLGPIFDFVAESAKARQPFLVWYAPMMPHTPHNPPERFLTRHKDKAPTIHVARYWAMVEWFDETCGELLDYLDREHLRENTIVAYVTDNGWIQDPTKGAFAPKSKQSPYDGGLRTPIMIRWPGKIMPATSPDLASSIDLMPTLLKAAGTDVPSGLPGINLLDEQARAGRDALFGACFTHDIVDLKNPAASLRWRWGLEGSWKIILPNPKLEPRAKPELYDVSKDPLEQKNLAEEHPERVAALAKKLDLWWDVR